jgi:hypothetical protein
MKPRGQKTKIKQLFRGVFNYSREIHVLRCHAYTKDQAWACMCERLAKMKGVTAESVRQRFNRKHGQYEIELEIEIKEVADEDH